MAGAGRRIGPTYDTLRIVIQPWKDRTTYSVVRVHHDGPLTLETRIASGAMHITASDLAVITPLGLVERVAGLLRPPAQRPAPPLGDMGEQSTLDLALRP